MSTDPIPFTLITYNDILTYRDTTSNQNATCNVTYIDNQQFDRWGVEFGTSDGADYYYEYCRGWDDPLFLLHLLSQCSGLRHRPLPRHRPQQGPRPRP
jgi:hypothetical protein